MMAEMEKEKIESSSMNILKIELNNEGEYITVSADNTVMFDRFAAGIRHLVEMANEMPKKFNEIEKQYKGKEDFQSEIDKAVAMSRENVAFSKEAVKIIDGIFGEDTVKKYFRKIYREIPDFLPSADRIIDFFEQITPPMEKIFNHKLSSEEKFRKQRMAKYQPQDHKKPARR